jgi:hypothetical protein
MRREDAGFAGRAADNSESARSPGCNTVRPGRPAALVARSAYAAGVLSAGTPEECVPSLQPANQQLALIDHFRRQAIVQIKEQLFLSEHFLTPGAVIEGL